MYLAPAGMSGLFDNISSWWNTTSPCDLSQGWILNSVCRQKVFNGPSVAPPPAPTGAALTVPPASGADAQALVDSLVNQQMTSQQALNASQVVPVDQTLLQFTAGVQNAVGGFDWTKWALIGGGVLAAVVVLQGRR